MLEAVRGLRGIRRAHVLRRMIGHQIQIQKPLPSSQSPPPDCAWVVAWVAQGLWCPVASSPTRGSLRRPDRSAQGSLGIGASGSVNTGAGHYPIPSHPPRLWLLEAPVRNMILQMHTPARTSQCWGRQTPAWTRSVHLDAPGQRHGQQPRLWDGRPPE